MNDNTKEDLIFGLSLATITFLCLAGVLVIVLVGWAIGGWFQVQDAKRQGVINNIQSHNYVHNYGYQQSQRDAVTSDVLEISQIAPQMVGQPKTERIALGNQRANALITLCSDASKVDPSQGPLPDAAFIKANCQGSVPNPSSPFETNPTTPNP